MKYCVTIVLTPGTDGQERLREFFDDQDAAVKFAQSAACTAHARTVPNSDVVMFFPAHRVDHVILEPVR